MSSKTSMQI